MIEADDVFQVDAWALEYPRLVRLCGALAGDVDAAEDLAQETLIEAWRHRDRLHDPDGLARWLSAIARNVCLRWRRRRGRSTQVGAAHQLQRSSEIEPAADVIADDFDLEIELERHELADLLDRAMASLPSEMRTILIQRYIEDRQHGEIAEQMGMSEGAVRVKLHRSKLAMKRILTSDFSHELAAYRLAEVEATVWHETRIWCPLCGTRRFTGRLDATAGAFELRCPDCYAATDTYAEYTSSMLFEGVAGYKAAFNRVMRFAGPFYQRALISRTARCPGCERSHATLHLVFPGEAPPGVGSTRGMYVHCDVCQSTAKMRLSNLVLYQSNAWQFWRRHPRICLLPERSIEADGRPAIVLSYISLQNPARLDAVVASDTYEILSIHQTHGA